VCNSFFFLYFILSEKKGKKISTQPFIPSGPAKHHATAGDYFGTFGPKLPGCFTIYSLHIK